ncbi:C-type lectin LmsL-like [Cloeon dipterum]|uniref:C-type lectin LmsL-like n=1 Tax=Cloeon dipterum TaxID=197152 RepID=UPI00321FBEF7
MVRRALLWFCFCLVLLFSAANVIQDVAHPATAEKPKGGCPENLTLTTLANGKKYYFSNKTNNRQNSLEFCEGNKMHLASPKTREDLELLHNKAKSIGTAKDWWVSLSNEGHAKDDFRWHDGERVALNSTLWDKFEQEPDQYTGATDVCAYINTNSQIGLWDYYCADSTNSFICECSN